MMPIILEAIDIPVILKSYSGSYLEPTVLEKYLAQQFLLFLPKISMKTARFRRYLQSKAERKMDSGSRSANKTQPIAGNEIKSNPDKHIDQDFPGYPYGMAKEELIKPETKSQKKTAALHIKDGEKMNTTPAEKMQGQQGEVDDGSAGAFEGTEEVKE